MRRAMASVMRMLRPAGSPIERKIGYRFKRKALLETALVHPSFRYERDRAEGDNQRMEFLGDAALGLVAAADLYRKFEDEEEGTLTALRSRITSGKALAGIAQTIRLSECIQLGRGEEMTGGRRRASTMADALEAVLGAAYLDGGLKAVEKIYARLFLPELRKCAPDLWAENPKGQLQDLGQRLYRASPHYRTVREDGPSHRRLFTVEVTLQGRVAGMGSGANKRDAQADAARDAVRNLDQEGLVRGE